jgi:hypothetical protein
LLLITLLVMPSQKERKWKWKWWKFKVKNWKLNDPYVPPNPSTVLNHSVRNKFSKNNKK